MFLANRSFEWREGSFCDSWISSSPACPLCTAATRAPQHPVQGVRTCMNQHPVQGVRTCMNQHGQTQHGTLRCLHGKLQILLGHRYLSRASFVRSLVGHFVLHLTQPFAIHHTVQQLLWKLYMCMCSQMPSAISASMVGAMPQSRSRCAPLANGAIHGGICSQAHKAANTTSCPIHQRCCSLQASTNKEEKLCTQSIPGQLHS